MAMSPEMRAMVAIDRAMVGLSRRECEMAIDLASERKVVSAARAVLRALDKLEGSDATDQRVWAWARAKWGPAREEEP